MTIDSNISVSPKINDQHDHDACVTDALLRAEELCKKQNVRLTDLRRNVLSLIWQTHKPIGAYALMDMLQEHSSRTKVAPPTVYRAIDFLIEQGLIHKVHSLNAYFGRSNPLREDYDALFICLGCGHTEEIPSNTIQQAINLSANKKRFAVEQQVLEITGRCKSCINEQRNKDSSK